jgi:hypothetical protein
MAKNKDKIPKSDPLSGSCFHVFGEDGKVERQGIVLSRIDDEHYLVQYLEWSTGYASGRQIVRVAEMASSPKNARGPWQWQFYKDDYDMLEWIERNGRKQIGHDARRPDQSEQTRRQWQWPRRKEDGPNGKKTKGA